MCDEGAIYVQDKTLPELHLFASLCYVHDKTLPELHLLASLCLALQCLSRRDVLERHCQSEQKSRSDQVVAGRIRVMSFGGTHDCFLLSSDLMYLRSSCHHRIIALVLLGFILLV